MKKTYVSPLLVSVNVNTDKHLLIDSGTRGITVDANQEVTSNMVRGNSSNYNVWNDDWSE